MTCWVLRCQNWGTRVLSVGIGLVDQVLTGTGTGGVIEEDAALDREAKVNGVVNVEGFLDVVGLDVATSFVGATLVTPLEDWRVI